MEHLGKWYLGFHLFPSIWFGLGEGVLEEISVWKKLKKSRTGEQGIFPKIRRSSGILPCMVSVEEQFWMIRCRLLVQENSEGK